MTFAPIVQVRIWPYTLSFETDASRRHQPQRTGSPFAVDRRRSGVADPPDAAGAAGRLRHGGDAAAATRDTILLLENNIEDVCRELSVFDTQNEAVMEEITGLSLRDHLINQLIMETGEDQVFDLAVLTANEFDVPATLVPERETELHSLLQFAREKLQLDALPDVSSRRFTAWRRSFPTCSSSCARICTRSCASTSCCGC